MYRTGHLGVSLLTYAPAGYALVVSGRPALAVAAGGVVLWLAMLPDVDHRLPVVSHRGVTHTLAFALVVGGVLAGGVLALSTVAAEAVAVEFVVAAFLAGAFAVLAHLLGDVLTPAGIPLLWPLSGRSYSLGVVRAANPIANAALFVAGVAATAAAALLAFGWV